MKKVHYLLTLLFLSVCSINAQEVKLDDGKILVDKTPRFDFARKNLSTEFSVYKLNTKDEIIYMTSEDNGTTRYYDDDYVRITFLEQKITIESLKLHGRSWKTIVKMLLEDKVLDLEGNIDPERMDRFFAKYNDVRY